ncbi:PREDICTED: RNA-binding KH domain-containing protein PEPPER-like [Nicotiana attenuata]|uniref:Rna-binding kh domain-containing protein pepper n=1 Tax=Nicotiana attenuata TaxID=49451 RepID=A0A314L9A3_NICAT|nr:PREDICTED: RNA-binding KH domain-containing protein PEPPER-like [Nicotiana attenuata]OIT38361.1 rna-binding kh domain-containing protein pepper [Nicotiana attenuata]
MVSSEVTDSQTESFPPSNQQPPSAVIPPPTELVALKSKDNTESFKPSNQQPPHTELVAVKSEDTTVAGSGNNSSSNNNNNNGGDAAAAVVLKWPGWPGDNVFRLVVPVLKVGSIIGRKGELVKKMCEETRARIRVLEGPLGNADRIVLISGREDPDTQVSPAMDAALRVFKRVAGLSDGDPGAVAAGAAFCSLRLLVASSQAIHLIGKQGSTIKSIQERSGASLRVLSEDDVPPYATSDERIVEIHGEGLKVLDALEAVLGQLRKFLVDHSVIPIFEKTCNANISQDRPAESWADKSQSSSFPPSVPAPTSQALAVSDYSLSMNRDTYFLDREATLDSKLRPSTLSLYGQDPGLGGLRTSVAGRTGPIVTQMTKVMQVPLSYAEDIIGIGGANIAYIRRTSGAILTVQESRGLPEEITIEIKGTSSEVQTAEQLIQEFISNHKEPAPSIYGTGGPGFGSFSRFSDSYSSSSFQSQRLGGYGSSSIGGYNSFRY